jgi:lysophospholipase L1-like esterase
MIVFLGDSITEWWDKELYNTYFGEHEGYNLGVSSHTTKDTLKHIEKHLSRYTRASTVILQIGTNDADNNMTTGETFENIQQICTNIFKLNPVARILLVGPLPRGESPHDKHRMYNKEVNKLLRASKKDPRITYIDIGHMFLEGDTTISCYVMYDFLHLTKRGYNILSGEIADRLSYSFSEPSAPPPPPRLS